VSELTSLGDDIMTTTVDEVAPDIFRISTYVGAADLSFAQFLVRDEQPLLYHTGMRQLFADVHAAVARLIDPATIRWIGFSHFEVDECGALNEWLASAPTAEALCSRTGVLVNMGDYAARPAHGLADHEAIATGSHRLRFHQTPHLPHGWDAGHLFDETTGTLLCSDILHQNGDRPALTRDDLIADTKAAIASYEGTPLRNYMPFTAQTDRFLRQLATLEPTTLATMHGSTYAGDGKAALLGFRELLEELFAA
jgi:flavorubredoxin